MYLPVVIVQRFVVERSKDQLLAIVTTFDPNPHPLANSRDLVRKLNLDIVARFVAWHYLSRNFHSTFPPKSMIQFAPACPCFQAPHHPEQFGASRDSRI